MHKSTANHWMHAHHVNVLLYDKMQHAILLSETIWLKYARAFPGYFYAIVFLRAFALRIHSSSYFVGLSRQLEAERHQSERRCGFVLLCCLVSERLDDIPTTVHMFILLLFFMSLDNLCRKRAWNISLKFLSE